MIAKIIAVGRDPQRGAGPTRSGARRDRRRDRGRDARNKSFLLDLLRPPRCGAGEVARAGSTRLTTELTGLAASRGLALIAAAVEAADQAGAVDRASFFAARGAGPTARAP